MSGLRYAGEDQKHKNALAQGLGAWFEVIQQNNLLGRISLFYEKMIDRYFEIFSCIVDEDRNIFLIYMSLCCIQQNNSHKFRNVSIAWENHGRCSEYDLIWLLQFCF